MEGSTGHLVRFLQQENRSLKEENEALQEENQALRWYMGALDDLYGATQRIASEENLLNLLDEILYNAMQLIKAEDGSVMLLDEETNELAFAVVHGDVSGELRGYRIGADVGVAGWVAAHGEPSIVNQPRQDPRFSPSVDESFGFVTRSLMSAPMITGNKTVGVINLLNKHDGAEFADADATLLSMLGHVAASALETMRIRLDAEDSKSTG